MSSSGARAGVLPISYRHLAAALLCGLALRLYFIAHFPFYSGDTKFYEELARNWLDHGIYGLFVNGQLMPVDQRMPGYPGISRSDLFRVRPHSNRGDARSSWD